MPRQVPPHAAPVFPLRSKLRKAKQSEAKQSKTKLSKARQGYVSKTKQSEANRAIRIAPAGSPRCRPGRFPPWSKARNAEQSKQSGEAEQSKAKVSVACDACHCFRN